MKWNSLATLVLLAAAVTCHAEPIDFEARIAPILSQHCVRCHSPGNPKGEVSLATFADLKTNEFVVPGNADDSPLIDLVTSQGGLPPEMPKEGKPLTKADVKLLRQWINDGAQWPEGFAVREKSKAGRNWWSLQPLASFEETKSIDDFIDARLSEKGLKRNPPADRRTLIRRATYDLTGLPPTPEQVAQFAADSDPDAYAKLIDRLLASPEYGERWGRHWLDVVRFGESNGFERNVIINSLWPFRDYVIRSINNDKPFDQFIREHLAGDVIAPNDSNVAVATAFLVAGPYDDVGNQDAAQAAQIRANTLDEMIRATSQAFLGMTVGCARCHDHKFDPILQRDYYSLYATFSGVRHGERTLADKSVQAARAKKLEPLNRRRTDLESAQQELRKAILTRAKKKKAIYQAGWTRDPVDRRGVVETFPTQTFKFIRLICEAQDRNPKAKSGFRVDEFEVWSATEKPVNVALSRNGGKATGAARKIEDFPGAYGPQLAIDGKTGARFIAAGHDLTIELAKPTPVNRVVFSSAKGEEAYLHSKFVFVAEYRLEVSDDGATWRALASGADRRPLDRPSFIEHRLISLETTDADRREQARLAKQLQQVKREIDTVPAIPKVWIGTRVASDAKGPHHVFVGGNPQKRGERVVPASLSAITDEKRAGYALPAGADESKRRAALAEWITGSDNPLTPRVLANRLWHYHFGTGIVDTPSDFGYMGGRPTHPKLLDHLAGLLLKHRWRIKPLHREIMLSQTYRQASTHREAAARIDGDSRLLWRFPPRRLSAEEIRDTILQVAGVLRHEGGGPGFRLYRFMQDNVCTYAPLDTHGPETYRRAVYHQNARASVVDLMTDFDQPDCAFSTPRRASTTTPLQALTMLNHSFTLDMAKAFAKRLNDEAEGDEAAQIELAFRLCCSRAPTSEETRACRALIETHGLPAFCRVMLNTSELIYLR